MSPTPTTPPYATVEVNFSNSGYLQACERFGGGPGLVPQWTVLGDLLAHRAGWHFDVVNHGEAVWSDVVDGAELAARLRELPGYGDEKARIFVALLAKRFGVRPRGWREACAPFDDEQPRSAADIDSPEAFEQVKAWKRTMRAQGKTKQDRPDPG